jgi:hypothetical protein
VLDNTCLGSYAVNTVLSEAIMTIFDLVFIVVLLGSIVTLALVALFALLGRRKRAIGLLRRYAIAAAIYLGIVLVVSPIAPRRELRLGEPLCFDDWCITVESAQRTAAASQEAYLVQMRLSSRARGISQRENGLVVYLTDAGGRRFDPVADPAAPPFNTLLHPLESVVTTRTFTVPRDVEQPALVITHEGGFPIGWFIIGQGPFHKAPIIRLDGSMPG